MAWCSLSELRTGFIAAAFLVLSQASADAPEQWKATGERSDQMCVGYVTIRVSDFIYHYIAKEIMAVVFGEDSPIAEGSCGLFRNAAIAAPTLSILMRCWLQALDDEIQLVLVVQKTRAGNWRVVVPCRVPDRSKLIFVKEITVPKTLSSEPVILSVQIKHQGEMTEFTKKPSYLYHLETSIKSETGTYYLGYQTWFVVYANEVGKPRVGLLGWRNTRYTPRVITSQ
jgi:hypothetical protein